MKYYIPLRNVWTICECIKDSWVDLDWFVLITICQLFCKQTNELRDQSNTQKETCHSRNVCLLINLLDL